MSKKISFIILFISLLTTKLYSQHGSNSDYSAETNLGIGLGIDYGGIGFRISVLPEKHLALFAAVGYDGIGAGFNGGAQYRFAPDHKTCPYFILMYGYNATIRIEDAYSHIDFFKKTYYGPSFGFGLELHSRKRFHNFWNLELLVPVRSTEFHDDIEDMENNALITFKSKPWPISISVGYHFGL